MGSPKDSWHIYAFNDVKKHWCIVSSSSSIGAVVSCGLLPRIIDAMGCYVYSLSDVQWSAEAVAPSFLEWWEMMGLALPPYIYGLMCLSCVHVWPWNEVQWYNNVRNWWSHITTCPAVPPWWCFLLHLYRRGRRTKQATEDTSLHTYKTQLALI